MTTIAQDEKSFIHFRQNIKLINLTRFQVKPVTPSWIKILQRTFSLLVAKHIENSNWGKIFWKWLKFLSFHNILLYYIKVYYYKIYLSIYAMLCYANLTWAFCVAPWNKDWSLFARVLKVDCDLGSMVHTISLEPSIQFFEFFTSGFIPIRLEKSQGVKELIRPQNC